jgi:MoaA/NifB/PqqE/SkfB family radical SAM enzyme
MEIWNSDEAKKLRAHMSYNDLDYGCQHCKYFFEKKKFSNLKPFVFDKYSSLNSEHLPTVLEFELSNECNLECQMCSGEVSSSIRKNRDKLPPIAMPYDEKFVEQLEVFIPQLKEAKFFGGEPFLISIYYDIWEKMLSMNPNIKFFVITNGSHWNNKIASLLERGHFDIAISIDGLSKEKQESIRKNSNFEKVIENIHRFNEYVLKNDRHLSLSFTVQKDNWEDFPKMIEFCNEIKAHVYVSYLEWPVHYAISNFSVEELEKIKNYLYKFSFPDRTTYQKHNQKCFEDFKNYVDNFIHQHEQKTYLEYRFGEVIKRDSPIESSSSYIEELQPQSLESTYSLQEYEAIFAQKIEMYFTSLKGVAEEERINKRVLIEEKLGQVFQQFNDAEKQRAYKLIFSGDWSSFIASVVNNPIEHLLRDSKRGIGKN